MSIPSSWPQPDHLSFDFSALDAFLELGEAQADPVRFAEILFNTQGYSIFAAHRSHMLSLDDLRHDVELLALPGSGNVKHLREWEDALLSRQELAALREHLHKNQTELMQSIIGTVFRWTPVFHYLPVKIHFLIDGRVSGYGVGGNWTCDLFPVFHKNMSKALLDIATDISHLVLTLELRQHCHQMWYHYQEKIHGALDICKLHILTELVACGIPRYVRLYCNSIRSYLPNVSEPEVAELDGLHQKFVHFLQELAQQSDPIAFYKREQSQFLSGRFSDFQILGTHICRVIGDQVGVDALQRCAANPMDFYHVFWTALGPDRRAALGMPLNEVEPAASSKTNPIVNVAVHMTARQTPRRGGVRLLPHVGPLHFCIVIAGAGACAETDSPIGTAHVLEHVVAHQLRTALPNLVFLKGLTTHRHCLYYGVASSNDADVVGHALEVLFDQQPPNGEHLEVSKNEVLKELQVVSRNPMYPLQEEVLSMLLKGGASIRGKPEDVLSISPDHLSQFWRRMYTPNRTVIATAEREPPVMLDGAMPSLEPRRDNCHNLISELRPSSSSQRQRWHRWAHPIAAYCIGYLLNTPGGVDRSSCERIKTHLRRSLEAITTQLADDQRLIAYPTVIGFGQYAILACNCQGTQGGIWATRKHLREAVASAFLARMDDTDHEELGGIVLTPCQRSTSDLVQLVVTTAEQAADAYCIGGVNRPNLSNLASPLNSNDNLNCWYIAGVGPSHLHDCW